MLKKAQYLLWKRRAQKAVKEGLTAVCDTCDDPIVPGDFIGIVEDSKGKEIFVHAGYHFSISSMSAFCETAGIGCAHWDGKQAVGQGESAMAKALRTGEPQII